EKTAGFGAERSIIQAVVAAKEQRHRRGSKRKRIAPVRRGGEPTIRGRAPFAPNVRAFQCRFTVGLPIGEADPSGIGGDIAVAENLFERGADREAFDAIVS